MLSSSPSHQTWWTSTDRHMCTDGQMVRRTDGAMLRCTRMEVACYDVPAHAPSRLTWTCDCQVTSRQPVHWGNTNFLTKARWHYSTTTLATLDSSPLPRIFSCESRCCGCMPCNAGKGETMQHFILLWNCVTITTPGLFKLCDPQQPWTLSSWTFSRIQPNIIRTKLKTNIQPANKHTHTQFELR